MFSNVVSYFLHKIRARSNELINANAFCWGLAAHTDVFNINRRAAFWLRWFKVAINVALCINNIQGGYWVLFHGVSFLISIRYIIVDCCVSQVVFATAWVRVLQSHQSK